VSFLTSSLVLASLLAAAAVVVFKLFRGGNRALFIVQLIVLLTAGLFFQWILGFHWSTAYTARGTVEESSLFVVWLYLSMLSGMAANSAYEHLGPHATPGTHPQWGTLLAPALVSPIVFLPLAASFDASSSTIGTGHRAPHLMLLLVAFQNGFFWQDFFRRRTRGYAAKGRK
jgi:hypothetical protein